MKTSVFILLAATILSQTAPAQSFKEQLQQGLYAEEVSGDLPAAITAYKGVIERYDADRKIAATALFRLAECHRKNGDDETATTLYNRLLRDFSDQTQLTAPTLAQLGIDPAAEATTGSARDIESRDIDNLRAAFADAPDLINAKAEDGLFPLEKFAAAGQANVVAYLLGAGASPDRTNALHRAILAGHKDVVTLLLDAGADPDRTASIRLSDGGTTYQLAPLHVAATTGNVALTQLLLEHGAPVDSPAYAPLGGGSPNNSGRRGGTTEVAKHIGRLSGERPSSTTALHIAIANRFPALTESLLASGADPALKNGYGQCATHLAVRANEPGLVVLLLEKGAPVDPADLGGYTPLLHAAYLNQTELVNVLIAAGASLEKAGKDSRNAAYFAVENNNLALLETCVSHGVPLDVSADGAVPLLHNAIGSHVDSALLKTLLDAGADPDIPGDRDRRPIHLAAELDAATAIDLLAAAGADLDARYSDSTPLMIAASRRHPTATAALINHGADVNARDQGGSTPLIFASSDEPAENSVAVATALVKAGAHIDATDSNGYSALHRAASTNNTPLTRYLLSAGADPLLRTNQDQWPLELAHNAETQSLLLIPTRNRAIELENQIFSYVPGDTSWRIPQTRAQEGFGPYTLFELLYVVRDAAFTTATIIRLDPETRQVASQQEINLADALTNGDASADVPLQWGDIVEYGRRTQFDPGLTQQQAEFLTAHMTRKIGLKIPYNPNADNPFSDKFHPTTVVPARWVTGPDRKTMVPDFTPSYDPKKNQLVGALSLSDAIEIITKHCDRKAASPLTLSRTLPDASGTPQTLLISNELPDGVGPPLSGFHTLTPLRTGDSVEIALGADPLPKPPTRPAGRRVILPPRNR